MRLLNTSPPHVMQEFFGESIPLYAILSHRWEAEEVTFSDIQNRSEDLYLKRGWQKIIKCCEQSASHFYEWVWIDSCCIDKSSSAELSEAINSMFAWYQNADMCYAYLSDVPSGNFDHSAVGSYFRRSKWFTRGWTLQELLAPKTLMFYDQDWFHIGTRAFFQTLISEITQIQDISRYQQASIAQKMCWASSRETTRLEDQAYSLMGLFGVAMPPMYGEGQQAFQRLQLEIMQVSDDETIFAWQDNAESGGLLAPSPAAFRDSWAVVRDEFDFMKPPYSMSNKGLRMDTYLLDGADPDTILSSASSECIVIPIQCRIDRQGGESNFIGIYVRRVERNQFARIASSKLAFLSPPQQEQLSQFLESQVDRDQVFFKQRKYGERPFQGPFVITISLGAGHGWLPGHELHISDSIRTECKVVDGKLQIVVDTGSPAKIGGVLVMHHAIGKIALVFMLGQGQLYAILRKEPQTNMTLPEFLSTEAPLLEKMLQTMSPININEVYCRSPLELHTVNNVEELWFFEVTCQARKLFSEIIDQRWDVEISQIDTETFTRRLNMGQYNV